MMSDELKASSLKFIVQRSYFIHRSYFIAPLAAGLAAREADFNSAGFVNRG
jgi:hypothetical protein